MLKSRPSKPFWVALSTDSALDSIEIKKLEEYFRTRDILELPIDCENGTVTETGEKVTLFKIKPLTVKGERVLDELGKSAKDILIGSHVVGIKNHPSCKIQTDKDGNTSLSVDSLSDEGLDGATRDELFQLILDSGRGADGDVRGFISPDGWRQQRMIAQLMPAVRARIAERENVVRLDLDENLEKDTNK